MKKKIRIILGIGLTLVLTVTLAIGLATPVPAADYPEGEWGIWGLPCLEWDTNIGPMAVAPDGTLYAAIHFLSGGDYYWKVAKSDDNGYTWSDTEFDNMESNSSGWMNGVASIVVSPNYTDDELVYLGIHEDEDGDPVVIRLEEAGEGDVVYLKDFPDHGTANEVDELWSIDVWTDEEDYNWIAAATDEDVFVLKDRVFEDWRYRELDTWSVEFDKGQGGGSVTYEFDDDGYGALEVAFAPDFAESDLLWAIFADDNTTEGNDFWITATVSPGQWGQDVGDGWIDLGASPWLDMDFPDDYNSDDEIIVYAGLSDGSENGAVWLIEGVDADDGFSNTTDLFDLSGDVTSPPLDIVSIAVSGDYGDEVILAGALGDPEIYISDDGGMNWDDVTKPPTGGDGDFSWTHVYMEADVVWGGEVFDPDEGMAFASTWGAESAVSRSNDGGEVYNQIGIIDTEIDYIYDLAFHPDEPATFMMITEDDSDDTYSLWLTENGDEEEPDYIRVLCGHISSPPGNFDGDFWLVEFSQDAEAIYIYGEDDWGDSSIWKSIDGGQIFARERNVRDDAEIYAWVIINDDTIYAAADEDGFYMTINSGLSWSSTNVGATMNDIALQPNFDPDDEDMDAILLGSASGGEVFVSTNGGDTFKNTGVPESGSTALTGEVYVAFDVGYADEDADGYKLIYACDNDDGNGDNAIIVGEEDGTDTEWDPLEDDTNKDYDSWITGDFFGLVVADDDALYAVADSATYDPTGDRTGEFSGKTGVARLLLHETNSLWQEEGATDLTDPEGLWLTYGSNVLWTINEPEGYDNELWVLEDTVQVVEATIDSEPDTLNLKSKGKWITAYMELPEGYDVADIDATTVLLNDTVPAVTDPKYDFVSDPGEYITDTDDDGILERMVKFDRSAVQTILEVGDEVEITVTGEVAGTPFEGSDIIRVIIKAPPPLDTHLLAVMASSFDSIANLDGAKIAPSRFGPYLQWMQTALATYGISFVPVYVAPVDQLEALRRGAVDAVLVTNHPSPYLEAPIASGEIRLLSWSAQAVKAVTETYPETRRTRLPPNTYQGHTETLLGYAPR